MMLWQHKEAAAAAKMMLFNLKKGDRCGEEIYVTISSKTFVFKDKMSRC